jgi:phage protein D
MGSAVKIAQPTITIAGRDEPELAQRLLSMEIREDIYGLYRCEIVFGNWGNKNKSIDFLYFDRGLLDFGNTMKIKLGTDTLFEGRIMGIEGQFPQGSPPAIALLVEDRFQDLRMTRRTRSFSNVSDIDVMDQIATEHGLSLSFAGASSNTYKVLAQVNQSDLAFLRERARAIDAEVWVDGRTLYAKDRTTRALNGAALKMSYGKDLREFSVLADLAMQRTSVTVGGWDVSSKSRLQQEATDSIINGELNSGVSGASILSSVLGEHKEVLAHTTPLTGQEAQTIAEAYFKLNARRFVTGYGTAETTPQLRVGNTIDLDGLGPLFNGKYYVSEVKHLFDGTNGLRSEFTAERPGLGRP